MWTTTINTAWMLTALAIGALWFFRYIFLIATDSSRCVLGSSSHTDGAGAARADLPRVSIVVAAKDEEANIESCVTSLLDQDYPDYEVIAVDDRSSDRTPQILRDLKARADRLHAGRLRVITIQHLREGWFGKNNAMREGIAASTGRFLLLTDADCRMTSRRTIIVAVREALARDADFLSITPILDAPTVWECLIQPACGMLLILWYLPYRVNDPSRKTAYANGAFMLIRRECYDGIGGHEPVRNEVNEDVHMARLAKRMGYRLRVAETSDLYRTRMYPTFAQAWRGWSRIFYGCLGSLRRLSISAAIVLLYTILPWISLFVAVVGWLRASAESAPPWMWAIAAWCTVLAAQHLALRRVYRMIQVPPRWALGHVIGAAVTFAMLVSAALKVVGATSTAWRGTVYRGKQVEPVQAGPDWREPAVNPASERT